MGMKSLALHVEQAVVLSTGCVPQKPLIKPTDHIWFPRKQQHNIRYTGKGEDFIEIKGHLICKVGVS